MFLQVQCVSILLMLIFSCNGLTHFKPNENRLINGTVTEIRNFPWQLSLRIRGGHVCGAIAVSATRALTAASCRDAHTPLNAYTILAGSTRRDGAGSGGFLTEVDHIIVHPLYNRITRVHDICVIWLDRGLPFGQNVRPVALPAEGAAVPYGARGYVSGWGFRQEHHSMAPKLEYIITPIITQKQCRNIYRERISSGMFCAGIVTGGFSPCAGDVGGPLIVEGVLHGIVSWGHRCGFRGHPWVFTRVSYYLKWVKTVV